MSDDRPKTIKITKDLHREIAMQSVRLDIDIQDIVADALKEKLAQLRKMKTPVAA